jgi:predicted O-methyltransferase YrrM
MTIFGLMCVRNEADILEFNIRYHLALGIDRILLIDNGSEDETVSVLGSLARSLPVEWRRRPGEFRQSHLMSDLACEAYLEGADWIVPIDADEFWHSHGRPLREILSETTAGILMASMVNYVQRRGQTTSSAAALLTMTRRPPQPRGPIARIEEQVTSRQIGFVEIEYPPKCIARASAATKIGQGNHWVEFAPGEQVRTDEIVCLHAPIRSRAQLDRKADIQRDPRELAHYKRLAWHLRWWEKLESEGRLDEEWAANSYAEDGTLDVGGVKRPTVHDPLLRDLVTPWVGATTAPARKTGDSTETLALGERLPSDFAENVLSRVLAIEGWLSEPEAALLMTMAVLSLLEQEVAPLVEIGSYCGRSTVAIAGAASAVTPLARVYAIDPHEGCVSYTHDGTFLTPATLERFHANIRDAGLEAVVRPIVKRSYEVAWTEPIGLLFIDGLHDYENVSRDYAAFAPFVRPGGYVLFDDYNVLFPGVMRFVDERERSGELERMTAVGKIRIMRKPAAAGAAMEDSVVRLDDERLRQRLERHERGAQVLRQLLFRKDERREQQLAERDAIIQALQTEMHEKVGEANRIIKALQAEMHEKIAEANTIISELQAALAGRSSS